MSSEVRHTSACLQRRSRGKGCLLRWTFVLILLLASSMLVNNSAGAGERAKPFQIGALTIAWGPTPGIVGLRDGLLELGYRENEQFVIGVRFTEGKLAELPAAARDLVQYGVDLIVAALEAPAKAAQMATSRIPIVFTEMGDPLGAGLIQSFARPGGNITGVTDLYLELGPKRLEVFREIVPGLKRVLFPYDPTDVYSVAEARAYRDAARRLGIPPEECVVFEDSDLGLEAARRAGMQGVDIRPWLPRSGA